MIVKHVRAEWNEDQIAELNPSYMSLNASSVIQMMHPAIRKGAEREYTLENCQIILRML